MFLLKIKNFYIIEKRTVVNVLFYTGMLLAYLGSLNPWFLWPIGAFYVIPSCGLIILSMLVSNSMDEPVFKLRDFVPAILAYIVLMYYLAFVNDANINGIIIQTFNVFIFLALFRIDSDEMQRLTTFLAKAMAVLLSVSIPVYFLYLLGFQLPSSNAVFGEDALYSYTNYYFFMLDDRSIFSTIMPRFHSVFLEPGHLGTATVLLLLTQIGKWKKWYNVVLVIATLLTFSLAAYVLFVVIMIFNSWCQRKHIVRKVVLSALVLAGIAVGAFFYNGGNNLIHDLILIRLEIEDGEMAGDNRVTEDFQAEFDSFLQSSDIFLGREMDRTSSGNSGFRVYIYENGIIGLLLVIVFYTLAFLHAKDKRACFAAVTVAVLCFIVRGYPLWYSNFIPLLCTAYLDFSNKSNNELKDENPVYC